jgi:choline dehydrogenase-like flavoprotein
MNEHRAEFAVVGSGFAGTLCARRLLDAGHEVVMIERGALRRDADGVPHDQREADLPTTARTHEAAPGSGDYDWKYGFGVGGSSLLWACVAPRLLPSDFDLRTKHGVGLDWPFSYEDLQPDFEEAELLMRVAGRADDNLPRRAPFPVEAPEPSEVDRLIGPLLEPWGVLAQARPPATATGYPPEPGGFDPGNSLLDVLGSPPFDGSGLRLLDRTAAVRLRRRGGRVQSVECVHASGERSEVSADTVVLAANGLENPALLLRSGLDGPHVGRWLFDHNHVLLQVRLDRDPGHGYAPARDSGVSFAWADGAWRGERASMVVIPYNPGLQVREALAEALADGSTGRGIRERLRERYARTLVLYVSGEDLPRRERFVELSPRRGPLGMPLNRIAYPRDSAYFERGVEAVIAGLEERLAPLGGRVVERGFGAQGGHLLGTCRMGDDGVVDENLRHHELENLYVVGGSAFPTYSALHPTVTIAALGVRLGKHLAPASRPPEPVADGPAP